MSDTPNEKNFMREKIVKPPIDKRRAAGRILCYVLFAVVSAALRGKLCRYPFRQQKKIWEKTSRQHPRRSRSSAIRIRPASRTPVETMAETTGEGIRSEDLKDEVEKIVGDAMEKFPWTTKNLTEFNDAFPEHLPGIRKKHRDSLGGENDVDWLDNPIETTGQYAGIIIAVNPSEALILTEQSAVAGADSLRVTFGDGSIAQWN